MTQALILAGGLGTRLRAIVSDKPKPMVAVGERPVLEHQILALRDAGIDQVILAIGHMAETVVDHFGTGANYGISIVYSVERELLGTAGAIRNAEQLIRNEPFLVLNGDTLMVDLDYSEVVREHGNATATLVAVRPPDDGAYGVLDLDPSYSRIVGFREKAPVDPEIAMISGGVYVLSPEVLEFIPVGRPVSIEMEVFPALLAEGRILRVHRYGGFFGDMGTPEGLERVSRYLQASRTRS